MLALVRGSGLLEYIKEEPTDAGCTCTVKRRGEDEVCRSFSMEDAKRAGLAGKQGPWAQYPKRMLQMRARSWALRDVFPDVLKGVYIAEEARDMPTEKDITADASTVDAENKPKTRADKARAALADRRKEVVTVRVVDVAEVMAAISQSDTMEALQAAAELAGKLTDEAEKKAARQKYADRLHAIKESAAPQETAVDPDDEFLRGLEAHQ